MNNKLVIWSFFTLALILSLYACTSPDPPVDLSFPYGTFTSGTNADQMVLDEDGDYVYSISGTEVTKGKFIIQNNQIIWETDSYCDAQGFGKATYTWTFEKDILIFEIQGKDDCPDRLSVLNHVKFRLER